MLEFQKVFWKEREEDAYKQKLQQLQEQQERKFRQRKVAVEEDQPEQEEKPKPQESKVKSKSTIRKVEHLKTEPDTVDKSELDKNSFISKLQNFAMPEIVKKPNKISQDMKIQDHEYQRDGPGESTAFQTVSEMTKTARATFFNNTN